MKRLGIALVLASCGSVRPSGGDGGADPGGDAPPQAHGTVLWQRPIIGAFPSVTLGPDDQPYVAANQFAALDLGTGILVPAGGDDVLVAHYSPDGQIESAWRHGGTAIEDAAGGMSIDPFGNIAIGGLIHGGGVWNAGGGDMPATTVFNGFAASYTPGGALRWQLPLTADVELFPQGSSTSGNGLICIAGEFKGTLDIAGDKRAAVGDSDVFYLVLDDTGKVRSLRTFGASGADAVGHARFDPLGSVMMVGTFSGQVAFGTTQLDAGGDPDLFVTRMTPAGDPIWAVQGTGNVSDVVAASIGSGDLIVAATYQGTFQMTGGDAVTAGGGSDFALVRISSTGAVLWTRSFGGTGSDHARRIAVGSDGEIAVTGEFNGAASFGGDSFTTKGSVDAFVAKYTADGQHIWSRAAGSAAEDRGLGVAVDASGAVYFSAEFHNTVDFGGGPVTAPGSDFAGVLVKYSP